MYIFPLSYELVGILHTRHDIFTWIVYARKRSEEDFRGGKAVVYCADNAASVSGGLLILIEPL